MLIYWDLDMTLFDYYRYWGEVESLLMNRGYTREQINRTVDELDVTGHSFEGHLRLLGESGESLAEGTRLLNELLATGATFLFPAATGTVEMLARRGHSQRLLTYGNPPYQQAKWAALSVLHAYFDVTHFVHTGPDKGDVIAGETSSEETAVFIDDSSRHLNSVREKAPWVRCIQPLWGLKSVPVKGEWEQAHTINELEQMLEE